MSSPKSSRQHQKIKLLVVDDHFVVSIGLTSALNLVQAAIERGIVSLDRARS